mmetsp:Transcript_8279/g.19472  ORF Transcript_8279/g.19472 Transcript_8279/m.19472 type:complete len:564 (-) Transcript_8279:50-1741(-)
MDERRPGGNELRESSHVGLTQKTLSRVALCCPGCYDFITKTLGLPAPPQINPAEVTQAIRQRLSQMRTLDSIDMSSLMMLSDPNRPLRKSYVLGEKLGKGGYGTVFKAKSLLHDATRAIKQIPKTNVKEDMKYVEQELQVMVSLNHPNVVRLYEFFEEPTMIYLVTELCTGGDFSDLSLETHEPEEIRTLFRDLMLAVSYCHDQMVAHRDIKFENCLITDGDLSLGRKLAKVIDFGLSAIRQPHDEVGKWMNETLGTKYFIAPEVIDQSVRYGVKCDLWSLGVMLFIVLTGEHPCAANAIKIPQAQLFSRIRRGTVRMAVMEEAGVDNDSKEAILRLLKRDPVDRIDARHALELDYFSAPKRRKAMWGKGQASRSSVNRFSAGLSRAMSFSGLSKFEKVILLLVAHRMEEKQVHELRQAFMSLDVAGNGSLSKDEVRAGLRSAGKDMGDEEFEALFRAIDINQNGSITYTEWLASTLEPENIATDKAIKELFSFFDLDGSGRISFSDLVSVLGEEVAIQALKEVGKAGNGSECLSYNEFRNLILHLEKDIERRYAAGRIGGKL